jgi:hypothetical protein
MADFFYDGQVRRYLTQFMRLMSNFSYKDAKGNLVEVPVRYGDMNRQVASIMKKNSENIIQSAPFIACYIKDMQFDRDRLQDPTFVSKVQIRERAYDDQGNEYLNTQGANYTVERMMPTPYLATFSADIWTTNTEQKLQLWEQIVVLFNPSLEIQTTDNYIDWTSLSVVELTGQQFESRTIPQGLESDISICNLSFSAPIWITPPAKVKQLGIITKIITNLHTDQPGTVASGSYKDMGLTDLFAGRVADSKTVVSPGNYCLLVINNTATLLPFKDGNSDGITSASEIANKGNWRKLLDLYPGEFKAGLSQIRLMKVDGNEVVSYVSLNPTDDSTMVMNIDSDTIPTNTIIDGSGTIDAIINPTTFNPLSSVAGVRYLILEDIVDGADAWRNTDNSPFVASANDIVKWDGELWTIIFNSVSVTDLTYIINSYTGIQYKWDGEQWTKTFEGVYDPGAWRLIL